jgi:hypothetical protein
MDRGYQSNQGRRVSHGSDEEGQDGAKRGEAERDAKKTTVQETNDNVVSQMLTGVLFDFGERQHELDST